MGCIAGFAHLAPTFKSPTNEIIFQTDKVKQRFYPESDIGRLHCLEIGVEQLRYVCERVVGRLQLYAIARRGDSTL